MASFFAGASNITMVDCEFNHVTGNMTILDKSRHITNVGSNNTYNTNVLSSHNDNSTTIDGWVPRDGDEGDHQIPSIPSSADYREDHTTSPPPQRPQLNPEQIASTGGTVINLDSHNTNNSNINNAYNNNSQNYCKGSASPIQKGHNGPQRMDPAGLRSTSGPYGSQFTVPVPFQAALSQQKGIGGPFGPHMSVNTALSQPMDQHMQRDFMKFVNSTFSHTQSIVAGIGGANNNPKVTYPASPNVEGNSINTGIANLSLEDSSSSHPQIGLKVTPPDQMDTSNPSTSDMSPYSNASQQGSHLNPSLAPHMYEPGMLNFFASPPATQQPKNNPNWPPPPVSISPFNFPPSSSGGPKFNTYHGNVTKHDCRVHETNIGSFNHETNTIQNSFNDNSLVNSTGKPLATESKKKRGLSEVVFPIETRKKRNSGEKTSSDPNRLQASLDEDDEQFYVCGTKCC